MTVEIDECHLHSRKYNVWRIQASELWWVVGGICRETREVFLAIVENRSVEELNKVIFQNVREGSMIVMDCWRGYNGVTRIGLNFTLLSVNHKQNIVDPNNPMAHTNTAERFCRSLREVPKQTRKVEVESYINQFKFSHNMKMRTNKTRFELLLDLFSEEWLFN